MSQATGNFGGKNAVLLLAHGTPDVLGEMAEYLSKVTGGRALPQAVVEELQHRLDDRFRLLTGGSLYSRSQSRAR